MESAVTTKMQFIGPDEDTKIRVTRTVVEKMPKVAGRKGTVSVTTTTSYDFDVTDFVVDKLPEHCHRCPAGICCNGVESCGRNTPMLPEDSKHRPSTCKLIDLDTYLSLQNQSEQAE